MKSGSIRVTILKDGSAKTYEHRDDIKAEGYRWNWIRGQWGKCEIDDLKKEFGLLLKAGVLTALEEGGALVVKDGFGGTYDARESIRNAGRFVFDTKKKVYFMQTPNDKMRRCVKQINEPYKNTKPKSLAEHATIMYEPFDAVRVGECLRLWGGSQKLKREAAMKELKNLLPAASTQDERGRLHKLLGDLRKWDARYAMVAALDAVLPQAREDGRRMLRVPYAYKADGAGRRYSTASWRDFGDGKLRCLALQSLPGDLRPKLSGRYLYDFDGVNSDPCIILNECRFADIPAERCACLQSFVDNRTDWIERVAEFYCFQGYGLASPEAPPEVMTSLRLAVKRWPNMLANGAAHTCLLEKAGLPSDCPLDTRLVQPMMTELIDIKEQLLTAPRNETFVIKHTKRLQGEFPEKSAHELQTSLFSLLISTREDQILEICVNAVRDANRDAMGADAFERLPDEEKHVGALVFDGQMAQLHEGVRQRVDANGRLELLNTIEAKLLSCEWHYKIDIKPNFGLQDLHVESAVKGEEALNEAILSYPSVGKAVWRACMPDPGPP